MPAQPGGTRPFGEGEEEGELQGVSLGGSSCPAAARLVGKRRVRHTNPMLPFHLPGALHGHCHPLLQREVLLK